MTGPTRVLIADDHPAIRVGLRATLEQAGFAVVFEAATASAAVEGALAHNPDVCLIDVRMPGSGITAAERITGALPSTSVVMLTVSREDEILFAALKAGAVGYLLKDIDPERLPDVLRAVLRGEAAMPRALVSRLVEELQTRGRRRLSLRGRIPVTLTSREWEVLQELRDGATTRQIAERLYVSPVTIRTHVSTILRKLRVADRASAVQVLNELDDL